MDILFISPPLSVDERYGKSVGNAGGHLPPLGLAALAAYVRKKGRTVNLIDSLIFDYTNDDLINIAEKDPPKVVCLTAITSVFNRSTECAKAFQKRFPNTLIILGGHHATIHSIKVMEENDCFDILAYGEGELTLMDILEKYEKYETKEAFLKNKKILLTIDGIAFKHNNEVTKNKARADIPNLDDLPFAARDLLPMEKYIPLPNQYKRLPSMHMLAIRGCVFSCDFCSNPAIFGNKFRARSPKKTVEEIKLLVDKYGAKEISFWDDLFTINKKWTEDVCDEIIAQGIDITWTCYARADCVNERILQKMAKAGCWNIFYGIETGNQQLLDNINKRLKVQQIKDAVKWTKEAGIEIRASFIIGLPGETLELGEETINFAIELDPDYAQFCINTPFPGTKLWDTADQWGALDKSNFDKYTIWEPVFLPFGYKDKNQLIQLNKKAFRKFYLRPKYIMGRLKKLKSFEDVKRYAKGARFVLGFTS
ncbi:radical SAM protein [Candidatus Woesearchaeota archaeon]|nr:radical SAM protein [Candidatus Woesearchaeota archaeon]